WVVPGSGGAARRDGRPWGPFTRAGSVERDALATGPGHEGDDGRGRGRVPQEADAPVAEQGIRPAGVPRVDLVVAGRVDHARPQSLAAFVALPAGQRRVGEHVTPRAAATGHRFDAAVRRLPVHFRLVNLAFAV